MEVGEFLKHVQEEVRSEIEERREDASGAYPYGESVFTEIVMRHMWEIGMTFEPTVCHYSVKVGNAALRLSGYAVSDDADELDLFVSLYEGVDEVRMLADTATRQAAEQCLRFLQRCVTGKLAAAIDQSHDAYQLAVTIQQSYAKLEQIRLFVLTDHQVKSKSFAARDVAGKTIKLEVMDIERLYRHWSAGKPRDELVVNFAEVAGEALPCVYVPAESADYDYIMTAVPAECLRFVYEKFGERVLEANVRSFLSVNGKVNKGIRDTLRDAPDRFMAYNNGIVLVADEAGMGQSGAGGPGLVWLKGMQIVNGGQTTASIYFTKKREPGIDLRRVRVPAKVIVLRSVEPSAEEALIGAISRYANSQNVVRASDLSANHPFHVELEKLSLATYCADGVSRWFYERAAGSYNTLLAREGSSPARLRRLREAIPASRRVTKTDLAKCLNAWNLMPDVVSQGSQKNFERFMGGIHDAEERGEFVPPDVSSYKAMIAVVVIYRAVQKITRSSFKAFQANVAAYTVALLSKELGGGIDLEKVWQARDVSNRLRGQINGWTQEVNAVLTRSAGARMVSEWAKKPECREVVLSASYSRPAPDLPEVAAVQRVSSPGRWGTGAAPGAHRL